MFLHHLVEDEFHRLVVKDLAAVRQRAFGFQAIEQLVKDRRRELFPLYFVGHKGVDQPGGGHAAQKAIPLDQQHRRALLGRAHRRAHAARPAADDYDIVFIFHL